MPSREVLCLDCPLACHMEVSISEEGTILECLGARCKRGLPYARQEIKSPKRVLTVTLLTKGSRAPLLPVRSDRPVPKEILLDAAVLLARLCVSPPIQAGQVLLADLMGTGANVIATDDLPEDRDLNP